MAREQLKVLHALDVAKTQRYHAWAVVIAGTGFFADAYDVFCVFLVTKLLGRIYYYAPGSTSPGAMPLRMSAAINGVTLCGMIAGQLVFGCLGDIVGRKRFYGNTIMLMILGSFFSGLSFGSTSGSVMATLCFFRFWLGVGIGGDYPLSATILAEYANRRTRGGFLAALYAMQGIGTLAGCVVTLLVSASFRAYFDAPPYEDDPEGSTPPEADYMWRLILMFGAIPALLTYHWRMRMPETARYTALVAKDAAKAVADMSKVLQVEMVEESEQIESITRDKNYGLFTARFLHRHGIHLFGTAACWFIVDMVLYSQEIFQKEIFSDVRWIPEAHTMSAVEEMYRIGRAQAIIALCGTVPGYWFTIALADAIGRRAIQLVGFSMMTAFMLFVALFYNSLTQHSHRIGLVLMYTFTFFFTTFGPNSTTFIIPAEIFPARLRTTCYGISAAMGRVGALVGTFGFLYAVQSSDDELTEEGYPPGIGVRNSLFVLAACNVLGVAFTCFLPEPKGKSLEELCGDSEVENAEAGDVGASRFTQVAPV